MLFGRTRARDRSRGHAAAGVAFTPAALPGLVLWLRADVGAASPVSSWTDQSSAGNNASQATSSLRPTKTTNINGRATVTFDGVDDNLALASRRALASGLTFAALVKSSSVATTSAYAGDPKQTLLGDSSGSVAVGWGIDGGKHQYRQFHTTLSWQTYTGAATVGNGSPHALIVTHDSATGAIALYTDSTTPDATATLAYNTGSVGVNAVGRGFSASDVWSGDVEEVLVCSGALSAGNVASLMAYLKGRGGI